MCNAIESLLYRSQIALLVALALGVADGAYALDTESREGAVAAAEQFIREGSYDTTRRCPDDWARLDEQKLHDMQPRCQRYTASESVAYAIEETDIFWRVFFRKVPLDCYEKRESFRVVEIFRASFPSVRLKDIELTLPTQAVRLRPDKAMQPTCEAARG